jgi:DNA-binding MarR family transcriptional regulator
VPAMPRDYRLEEQIGFLLRRAYQRHVAIFHEGMPEDLTPTQFAAMARLLERGPLSQNLLGREIAMDAATIKGVVERLQSRGFVEVVPDPTDGRRRSVSLTKAGERTLSKCLPAAVRISKATLKPLDGDDPSTLLALLGRIADGA